MKSRMLGLLAFALIGASGSAASMGDDAADPNSTDVYLFFSPLLTGTLDGQLFQAPLTAQVTFTNGVTDSILFSIDGVQSGFGGLEPVANQPEKWCATSGCITKVPDGLDVQLSQSLNDEAESLEITSTGTSISFDGVPFSGPPRVSLSASGGPGTWEVFVNVPEPSPLALWGAALLVFVLLERSRIVSKGRD